MNSVHPSINISTVTTPPPPNRFPEIRREIAWNESALYYARASCTTFFNPQLPAYLGTLRQHNLCAVNSCIFVFKVYAYPEYISVAFSAVDTHWCLQVEPLSCMSYQGCKHNRRPESYDKGTYIEQINFHWSWCISVSHPAQLPKQAHAKRQQQNLKEKLFYFSTSFYGVVTESPSWYCNDSVKTRNISRTLKHHAGFWLWSIRQPQTYHCSRDAQRKLHALHQAWS